METLTESSTPPSIGTDLSLTVLVGPATEVRVSDNPLRPDLVVLHFDDAGGRICIQGDLATMQRWVDEAAHQLMLVSTQRGAREEVLDLDARARGLAGVASLRDAATDARREALKCVANGCEDHAPFTSEQMAASHEGSRHEGAQTVFPAVTV